MTLMIPMVMGPILWRLKVPTCQTPIDLREAEGLLTRDAQLQPRSGELLKYVKPAGWTVMVYYVNTF